MKKNQEKALDYDFLRLYEMNERLQRFPSFVRGIERLANGKSYGNGKKVLPEMARKGMK